MIDPLTRRERAVLAHLCEGRVVAEIAELEHVAVSTVRSQVKAILRKFGVHSQVAALAVGCSEVRNYHSRGEQVAGGDTGPGEVEQR